MRVQLLVPASILLAIAGVLVAPAASATTPVVVTCGAHLSGPAVLAADLTCGDDIALQLSGTASLDLRGHTLRGTGNNTGFQTDKTAAASVRNGTITGFGQGVTSVPFDGESENTGAITLTGVTLRGNRTAVQGSGDFGGAWGPSFTLRSSTVIGNFVGFSIFFGSSLTLSSSTVADNGEGIHVDTGGVTITGSTIRGNETGLTCNEAGCSISRSRLTGNGVGIASQSVGFGGAIVDHTVFDSNGTAWHGAATNRETSTDNVFTSNGVGIDMVSADVVLTRSGFAKNGTGLRLSGSSWVGGSSTISSNVFAANTNGIEITDTPTAVLTANYAVGNTKDGINAPGVRDGGRNRAVGNGSRPQCVGVRC
jgi:hypothetical protein